MEVYQPCTAVSWLIVRNSRGVHEQRTDSDCWCIVKEGMAKKKAGEYNQMVAISL